MMYYETLRNSNQKTLIDKISRHGKMHPKSVEKVLKHVLFDTHDLYTGINRFTPDYQMARSFQRLIEGKDMKPLDFILLKHERLEYELETRYKKPHDKAHNLAESRYNYTVLAKRVEETEENHGRHKADRKK